VFVQLAFLFFVGGGIKDPNSMALGKIIFIFAVFMLVGALVSWAWIPSVQDRELETPYALRTKTLEELSGGLQSVKEEDRVGIRAQAKEIRKRIRK
jgi:PHS family inorganic phosphate transporter-like MFS transporter